MTQRRRETDRRPGNVFAAALSALLLLTGAATPAAAELVELSGPKASAIASAPRFERLSDGAVRFRMTLSQPLSHQVFSLEGPDRLVVDFPELDWSFVGPAPDFGVSDGLNGLRVGLFRVGRSRMVFDLGGAPEVLNHSVRPEATGGAVFSIDFKISNFETGDIPERIEQIVRPAARTVRSAGAPQSARRPAQRPQPMIVALDPGHGGGDAGAVYGGHREKDVVLNAAKALRKELHQPGRIHVVLTRDRDEFVSLDKRVERARAAGADMFISLHVNSFERDRRISGAGVYTLSEVASDALSSRLARRENAADAIAGVPMAGVDDQVRQILVDFRRRQMMDESHRLARTLITKLKTSVRMERKNQHRHANFRVLRNFDMPSVLIELGYITNIEDRRAMANPAWRQAASKAIARAVTDWAGQGDGQIREAALRQ